jgi:acetoacetate decarboxylase
LNKRVSIDIYKQNGGIVMILKSRTQSCLFVLLLTVVFPCLAQNFEGTVLSHTQPFYSELPYVFEGSENYFISFKSDPDVMRALVPEPLKPIPGGEMTVVFAKHKIVSPINITYNEAYLIIPVSYGAKYGGYIPVLYLDKIETITPAREIWGYNKVGGEFQFIEKDGKMSITVTQLDTLLMKASFVLGEPFIPPEQPPGGPAFNLKHIPSVVKDAPPDVKQITISESKDSRTTQMRLGKATLAFYSSHYNPLGAIPIMEIMKAGYRIHSFSMVYGDVLYDYLKNE